MAKKKIQLKRFRDIRYARPKVARKRRPTGRRPAPRRLSVLPLSWERGGQSLDPKEQTPKLVLPFELQAAARTSITLVSKEGRILGRRSVQAKRGLNRVVLPASFERRLTEGQASLAVSVRGGYTGGVDIPGQTETGYCTLRQVARFTSKIAGVAGYFAHNDDRQHVIVATEDGKVTELSFSNDPNTPGVGWALLAQFWYPLVGVAAYYAEDDHFQHVFVAGGDNSGTVWEIRWDPSLPNYKLTIEWLGMLPGIQTIAAFVAPSTGWIAGWRDAPGEYRHFVHISDAGRTHDKLFLLPPVDSLNPARSILFNPDKISGFDLPPPPAAFYSMSQNALAFVGMDRSVDPATIHAEVIPLDAWVPKNGDVEFGKYRDGSTLFPVGNDGKIAGCEPDQIIVTGAQSPGDVFQIYPDPGMTSNTCDTRMDARFYPGPRRDYPTVSWCKSKLTHFEGNIVALAAYFAMPTLLGPGGNHAVVATDKGDVFDVAFNSFSLG